jgi:serine phosphatase RsbU (regulator of sigma subunit)
MSVLGIALLDEIVNKNEILTANEILDKLRENVIKSFKSNTSKQTKDGMDLGLIVFDPKNMSLEYAGAYNPMILVRNKEAVIYKADRRPVGFHDKLNEPFTNHVLEVQKGDRIYLSSDGFIDQFGGDNEKKFMLNRFSQLLADSSNLSMNEQKAFIEKVFDGWKGKIDQVDDVVVLGMQV